MAQAGKGKTSSKAIEAAANATRTPRQRCLTRSHPSDDLARHSIRPLWPPSRRPANAARGCTRLETVTRLQTAGSCATSPSSKLRRVGPGWQAVGRLWSWLPGPPHSLQGLIANQRRRSLHADRRPFWQTALSHPETPGQDDIPSDILWREEPTEEGHLRNTNRLDT